MKCLKSIVKRLFCEYFGRHEWVEYNVTLEDKPYSKYYQCKMCGEIADNKKRTL